MSLQEPFSKRKNSLFLSHLGASPGHLGRFQARIGVAPASCKLVAAVLDCLSLRCPLGSFKYPLPRKPMPRIHRASGPVTMGCLCHSFLVKLTSASTTVSCWDPPVTPETFRNGIKVHCVPASTEALYFFGSDVPGHRINTVQ